MNESELIVGTTGSATHWTEQIVQSQRFLLSTAERMMSDALRANVTASDIVQQTLLAAIRDKDSFQGATDRELTQWLKQILKHRIVDEARRWDARKRIASAKPVATTGGTLVSHSTPLGDLVALETKERLLQAIQRLEPQQQAIIRLRYVESLSFEKISRKLNLSANAVRQVLVKALRNLGQELDVD